jgi:hypothetical protein
MDMDKLGDLLLKNDVNYLFLLIKKKEFVEGQIEIKTRVR